MKFTPSFGPMKAIALGLALLSAGPAFAQKTIPTAKSTKVKTKISDADGNTLSKTKTEVAPVADVAVVSPQPVSPLVSEPQVVVAAAPMAASARAEGEMPAGWVSDLGAALAQAKVSNRPILAVFSGSDWCKPCIMYQQEVFAKPEFMDFAKGKLVLAHFDFPRQKKNQPSVAQVKLNEAAAAQLNREGDFPLAVVIAPDGKVLAKTGYIAGGPAAFEAYLKKVVPTL